MHFLLSGSVTLVFAEGHAGLVAAAHKGVPVEASVRSLNGNAGPPHPRLVRHSKLTPASDYIITPLVVMEKDTS
ncbi:hypothetical protein EYF80_031048 [Liparis tanakae]|uniref:Uncharacterized protein n=1 Tax=Liparis tanakae TaxID=230148 RepID=A0A4Z2H0X1_9TELE|nr:hypothetical protein EYF80_031048 [Liparis tanakae]